MATLRGSTMLCGCIDIGTNTTRVLVAEASNGRLTEVLQRRAFTRIGRGLRQGGRIPPEKISEVAAVVAEQRALAARVGATLLRIVATAAIRSAANRDEFVAAITSAGGSPVDVLDGREEARLAFLGATRTLGRPLAGAVGVVDVGGGSTEIAVGTVAAGAAWSASFGVGSGALAEQYLHDDPPTVEQMQAVRRHALEAFQVLEIPPVACAVAVGGSAQSMRRFVGAELAPDTLERALGVLRSDSARNIARRFSLDPERVKLLPAGILVLDAAAQRLGWPMQIGQGGLREGVLLELSGA